MENKKGSTYWLRPETIAKMDRLMASDNCQSRSEFVEKSVEFYTGYLDCLDASNYLGPVLSATTKGILRTTITVSALCSSNGRWS